MSILQDTSKALHNDLLDDMHHRMKKEDLSILQAARNTVEDRVWNPFEIFELAKETLEEYDCYQSGIRVHDFRECFEEYTHTILVDRLESLWTEKRQQEN